MTRKDRLPQAALLGPGVALTTIAALEIFRDATAIGWIILAVGLSLLSLFGTLQLRDRAR